MQAHETFIYWSKIYSDTRQFSIDRWKDAVEGVLELLEAGGKHFPIFEPSFECKIDPRKLLTERKRSWKS